MRRSKSLAILTLVITAAVLIGTAVASNMAFKFNALVRASSSEPGGTGSCSFCGNWTSLPVVSEFEGQALSAICTENPNFASVGQTGFTTCAGFPSVCTNDETLIDDIGAQRTCSLAPGFGVDPPYQSQKPIQIVLNPGVGDDSQVFVGSHDPGVQILLRRSAASGGTGTCSFCGNWVQAVYHTTATALSSICSENPNFDVVAQTGFTTCAGFPAVCTNDETLIDDIGAQRICSLSPGFGVDPPFQLGKPVLVTLTSGTGDVLWSPAHF